MHIVGVVDSDVGRAPVGDWHGDECPVRREHIGHRRDKRPLRLRWGGFVDMETLQWNKPMIVKVDENMANFLDYNRDK